MPRAGWVEDVREMLESVGERETLLRSTVKQRLLRLGVLIVETECSSSMWASIEKVRACGRAVVGRVDGPRPREKPRVKPPWRVWRGMLCLASSLRGNLSMSII